MNSLDVGVLVLLAAFAVYGAFKGIVRLILGTGAGMAGLALGVWLNKEVAAYLPDWIESEGGRRLAAVALVMAATILLASLLIWAIQRFLTAVKLRWVDRLTGSLLGLAVASFLIAAAMLPLAAFLPAESDLIRASRTAPYILQVSDLLRSLVPREMEERFEKAKLKLAEARSGVITDGVDLIKGDKKD